MKIICTYSNLEWAIADFSKGPNTSTTTPHPIFSWEPKQLLNQAGRWSRGELSATERRLLFLALLRATELVDWNSPAFPSDATVQKNMQILMQTLTWKLSYGTRIPLPRMTIKYPETHTLDNIEQWINIWNRRKQEYLTGYKTVFRQENLLQSEQVLERLIKSAHKKSTDYAKQLYDWFVTAADVPTGMQDKYLSIFRLKGYEIFNARKEDIADLLTYAECNLSANDQGSIFGNATMKHLRMLELKNRLGLRGELEGQPKFTFDERNENDLPEITDTMIANAKIAPDTKPHPSEIGSKYATKIDYLRALAYYGQKQTVEAARNAMEKAAQTKIDNIDTALQDAEIDREFQHLDDEDDINQLNLHLSNEEL